MKLNIRPSDILTKVEREIHININHFDNLFIIDARQSTGIRWVYHQRDKAIEGPEFFTEEIDGEEACYRATGKFPLSLLTLKGTPRNKNRVSDIFNY